MLTQHRERVIRVLGDGRLLVCGPGGEVDAVRADDGGPRVPDMDDACTRGGLLQLVREAWGDRSDEIMPFLAYAWRDGKWENGDETSTYDNALVVALLAAPVRP